MPDKKKKHIQNPKKIYKDDKTFTGQDKKVIMQNYREEKKFEKWARKKNKKVEDTGKYDKNRAYRSGRAKPGYVPSVELKDELTTKKQRMDVLEDRLKDSKKAILINKSGDDFMSSDTSKDNTVTTVNKRNPSRSVPTTALDKSREITGEGKLGHTAAGGYKSKAQRKKHGKTLSKGSIKETTFDPIEAGKGARMTKEQFTFGTKGTKPNKYKDYGEYDASKRESTKTYSRGKEEKTSLHDETKAKGYRRATELAEKRRLKHKKDGKSPASAYGGFAVTVKTKSKGTGTKARAKTKYKVKKIRRKA